MTQLINTDKKSAFVEGKLRNDRSYPEKFTNRYLWAEKDSLCTNLKTVCGMYRSVFLCLAVFATTGCATRLNENAARSYVSDSAVAEKKESIQEPVKSKRQVDPLIVCDHGAEGGVVSCTNLDCTRLNNVSNAECAVIRQKLLIQAGGLTEFASSGNTDNDGIKTIKQHYSNNTIFCLFNPDTSESKEKVEWAKFQAMSCFLETP